MSDAKHYSQMKREMEKLISKKNNIMDECTKKGASYEEYQEEVHSTVEGIYFLEKELRKIKEPTMIFGREWNGITYTIDEFIEMVNNKELTDEDGFGNYATSTAKSDIIIKPSDITEGIFRLDFTHVIWFELINKDNA